MIAQKPTREEKKLRDLAAQAIKDKQRVLVVKIINWRTGTTTSTTSLAKITAREWQKYRQYICAIYKTDSRDKVNQRLQEVYQQIKSRGGFE